MLSKESEKTLDRAIRWAQSEKHEYVTPEHLLMALIEDADAFNTLRACGVNVEVLRDDIKSHFKDKIPKNNESGPDKTEDQKKPTLQDSLAKLPEITNSFRRIIQRAVIQAQSSGKTSVTTGNLLVAFFEEKDSFALYFLEKQNVTRFDVINFISHGINKGAVHPALPPGESAGSSGPTKGTLEQFTVNLNEKAKKGLIDPVIGRDDVIERIIQVLCRRTKNNPLLVGEPGVGKTAIAEGLALKIHENDVPEILKNKTILNLDIGLLLAGTKFRGDFEDRLKNVVAEVQANPDYVLFIDEIHTIVGAGGTQGGSLDASNLLKPSLADGSLSCIGSTTHKDFRTHFEKDRALARRFQKIDINEPSVPDTIKILTGLKGKYEEFHNVVYSSSVIKAIAELSAKHITGRHLPDKAIDVLDEAGARHQVFGKASKKNISVQEIEDIVAQIARIPSQQVTSHDKTNLKNLSRNLKLVIYGQDKAIEVLASAIKVARSGLRSGNKPVGSFLFAGPTGVGKTEVTRQLAQQLGVQILRYDMSEYMEKHAVSRLVGAPPGYVGYEEGGLLTEAVNKTPYCVILFDEIEKAHPDLINILLQVMDNGQLTDSNGRTSDFRNAIIVLTTNAGARETSKSEIGIKPAEVQGRFMEAIKQTFSPEFLNRLDAVVPFAELTPEIIDQVTQKFIIELQELLREKKVEITLSARAMKWLSEKGFDRAMGARPMARVINEHLKQPLVDEILFGKLAKGGRVNVDLVEDKFSFEFFSLKSNTKEKVKEEA